MRKSIALSVISIENLNNLKLSYIFDKTLLFPLFLISVIEQ